MSIGPSAPGGLTAGSRIGGYLLQEQIGHGGMAVVFRALDERLQRHVALKVLTAVFAEDEAFRQRFMRESRAAAAVDDPHIIPVFDAGEASGVLFIAMRFVRGGDVHSLVSRAGPLPFGQAMEIVSPVASALDAAHDAGLVHRDVKPANMLLDIRPGRPDHVYLSDFGLTKATLQATRLTGTGMFLGTLDYTAPEQIEGKPVDGRADQYSLACAAFELLTGNPPFQRDAAMAVIFAHLSDSRPSLTSRRPDIPPAADRVFFKALARAAADRYATCQEFSEALGEVLGAIPHYSGQRTGPVAAPAESEGAVTAPGTASRPDAALPSTEIPQQESIPTNADQAPGNQRAWLRWRSPAAPIGAVIGLLALGGGAVALALGNGHGTPKVSTMAVPGCTTAIARAT